MRIEDAFISNAFRYFVSTAEAGSIRAAARELNIASSAVNRQILMLEDALGMRLFERTGRAMRLTEAGSILLNQAKMAMQDYEDALGTIDALRGLRRGRVRLATAESVSVNLLPEMLAEFSERFPQIEVALTVTVADTVTEMVRAREADLGFTYNPTALDGLEVAYETRLQIGAIVSPDHPLAERESVSLPDCLAYPYAYPARGLSLRHALDEAMKDVPEKALPVLEANSLRVMAAMAREGRCVAFQTRVGIEQHLDSGVLRFLPLTDEHLPLDRLMVVRQRARTPSPAAKAFEDYAAEKLEAYRFN